MSGIIRLTISDAGDHRTTGLEVCGETSLETLQVLIELDLGIETSKQVITHNGKCISSNAGTCTIDEMGIPDEALLLVGRNQTPAAAPTMPLSNNPFGTLDFSNIIVDPSSNSVRIANEPQPVDRLRFEAKQLIQLYQADPTVLGEYLARDPTLGEAVRSKKEDEVFNVLSDRFAKKEKEDGEYRRRMAAVAADPLGLEAQQILEEEVRRQNVNDLLSYAQEHMPESFANVVMLYVNIEVNGIAIKAFVDSGAQSTIMSKRFAEKCNLQRLVDTRFKGVAHGVGVSNIVGRIHSAQIRIGTGFFGASIIVLEDDKMDFLFGLDLLRRHQMCIDLRKNALTIGSDIEVPFLSEKDLKDVLRDAAERTEKALAQAPTQSGASSSNAPKDQPKDQHASTDEAKISRLMSLGFSRDVCQNALAMTGGDPELAASLLLRP